MLAKLGKTKTISKIKLKQNKEARVKNCAPVAGYIPNSESAYTQLTYLPVESTRRF